MSDQVLSEERSWQNEVSAAYQENDRPSPVVNNKRGRPKKPAEQAEPVYNWPDESIFYLIELWKNREILYNPRHPKYHIKEENTNAIQEICELFQERGIILTAEQINKKLTTLKSYYCKERGKLTSSKKSGAGADQVYTVKWKYFSHLDFLNDHITPHSTISTFSASFPSDYNNSKTSSPQKRFKNKINK